MGLYYGLGAGRALPAFLLPLLTVPPPAAEVTCAPNQFQCAITKRCIPRVWVCDRDNDCVDGSDEPANCSKDPSQGGANRGRCSPCSLHCSSDVCGAESLLFPAGLLALEAADGAAPSGSVQVQLQGSPMGEMTAVLNAPSPYLHPFLSLQHK